MNTIKLGLDSYCHSVSELAAGLAPGFYLDYPAPNELFIDLDTEEAFAQFEKNYFLLWSLLGAGGVGIEHTQVTPSKSGLPNRHVRVFLSVPVTMPQRTIFQLFLGSDPARELMNYAAWQNGEEQPSVFVEVRL